MAKGPKKAVSGLIFALGLIAILIGTLTDIYTTTVGVIIMLGIWFIGGAIVAIAMGSKKGEPPTQQPPQQQPPEQPPTQEPPTQQPPEQPPTQEPPTQQ